MQPLTVGIFLFPDYETLDVMGPVELLGCPPVKDMFTLLFVTEDGEAASNSGECILPRPVLHCI